MFVIGIYILFVLLFSQTTFIVNSIKYHEIATGTLLGLRAPSDYCHFISLLVATLTNIYFLFYLLTDRIKNRNRYFLLVLFKQQNHYLHLTTVWWYRKQVRWENYNCRLLRIIYINLNSKIFVIVFYIMLISI